jgi:thiamine biosynthesis lipoprotein
MQNTQDSQGTPDSQETQGTQETNENRRSIVTAIVLLGILVGVAVWRSQGYSASGLKLYRHTGTHIMSTEYRVLVTVPATTSPQKCEGICRTATEAGRWVEREMNIYNPYSPLSKFNAAAPGDYPLDPKLVGVLRLSRDVWTASGGAFDVTARPLIGLWKTSLKAGIVPDAAARKTARNKSGWADFTLPATGATVGKKRTSACVDLGGVAKGYAIDLAVESLIAQGAIGGMVEFGGDVRCFGRKPDGKPWRMGLADPYHPHAIYLDPAGAIVILGLGDEAVCTSGDYARGEEIKGRRYSHIVNPATLGATTKSPSVTVIAPDAMTADAWATALSVLGPAGLEKLKGTKVEAMILMGDTEETTVYYATENFERRFLTDMKYPKGK